jgi:DNA topoisomerase-6 subunit B
MAVASKITSSSTAEYFSKNLQQVGFSSGTKAVLTTLKESVDNSLDACEDAQILPEVTIEIEKVGVGSQKNMDQIRILVRDNGPGIPTEDLSRVYGEYLASSKFGRGRCSRGQQGIGISAATTWAQLTSAQGVKVITKTKAMRQAIQGIVEVDIKKNQGVLKDKKSIDWDRPHGTSVEFILDGRLQMQGEGGVLTYLTATSLVNPHLTLNYKINDEALVKLERVTKIPVDIPEAVAPHPHTLKLGEFLSHGTLFGKSTLETFLKKGFSRINDPVIDQLKKNGLPKGLLDKSISSISDKDLKTVYEVIQKTELMPPNTRSVLSIGEEGLADSIKRLGEIDFFSVVSRKPRICDFKPVVVEVAIARFLKSAGEADDPVTVLRFANRVPLQFDKSSCAIVKALESVNWRAYGLAQPKNSLPLGPYVVAVSVVSPFIKFKNASKETIDGSDELVEELRLALIQAGQRLSRYIKREQKEFDLEKKKQHIEQFGPILIECLGRITKAPQSRLEKAKLGMLKILGRDADKAEGDLETAVQKQSKLDERMKKSSEADDDSNDKNNDDSNEEANA